MYKNTFYKDVLNHYDSSQRILPWRESRNPYYIWVSEIMLQQTRVETVIPYYNRFIREIPSVKELSVTEEDKLYKLWEGLGYYSRVLNMKKAAIQVMEEFEGIIPKTRKELESLKGIGPYTSGAVSSIAFEKRNSAVDGNVLRIFYRLLELEMDTKNTDGKRIVKETVESLLPQKRIGDFNQGLMEIGATICLPNGAPLCEICPIKSYCKSYENNTQNTIPFKRKKQPVPKKEKTVLLLNYKNQYAIEKRPSHGLLKSMYQFVLKEEHITKEELLRKFGDVVKTITKLPSTKHKFSHLEWHMIGYEIELNTKPNDYTFVSIDQILNEYSIPSAFKKYKEYLKERNYE